VGIDVVSKTLYHLKVKNLKSTYDMTYRIHNHHVTYSCKASTPNMRTW